MPPPHDCQTPLSPLLPFDSDARRDLGGTATAAPPGQLEPDAPHPDTAAAFAQPLGPDTAVTPPSRRFALRPLLLVLVSVCCGLGALYLVRAALVDVGGFALDPATAVRQLLRLLSEWRFWIGAVLLAGVMLISLELYGSQDLSKVVPLYSMSYVLIAIIGQVFLDERVTPLRWVGILSIVVGVVVLQRS